MFSWLIQGVRSRRQRSTADRLIEMGNRAEARGELPAACEQYRAAVKSAPDYPATHLNLGIGLEKAGDAAGARSAYEQALALDAANPFANYNLAKLCYLAGNPEQARQALQTALRSKPAFPEASVLLARLHEDSGELDAAAAALATAIEKRPTYVEAITSLAGLLMRQGRLAEATARYEQAIALQPRSAEIQWQLGNVLADQGRLDDATWRYRQALAIAPDLVEAEHSLCMIAYAKDRPAEAIACLKALAARHPHFARAHVSLGNILRGERLITEAGAAFARALALAPGEAGAHFGAGNVERDRDDRGAALRHYESALSLAPDHIRARWAAAMCQLQAVYPSQAAAQEARADFSRKLEELERRIGESNALGAVEAVGEQTPFYLAYREENNRELLARHGALCARVMSAWQEHQNLPRDASRRSANVIRVGFVSAHFHNHSVWNALIKGWFEHLDRKRFAPEAFSLGTEQDQEAKTARSLATHFEAGSGSLSRWARAIAARRPDVLIYPEIGMDAMTVKLASLRLAPVQVTTWGHPETSGLPTIDYFLSAQGLEPELADAHYSEKLVLLPNLGCCYASPPTALIDSGTADPDTPGPVLICPGTPFKYAPEHDGVLADIAAQLDDCRLVFFRHRIPELSDKLEQRLRAQYERRGVDARKLQFVPWQSPSAFRQLMRRSSVLLDTIGFSGFNTALQAVECGLPIVTREGRFLRGRLASGILKRMGLNEMVAASENDYVSLALKLCRDRGYRDDLARRISAARSVLYDDRSPVRALEEFLARAVTAH